MGDIKVTDHRGFRQRTHRMTLSAAALFCALALSFIAPQTARAASNPKYAAIVIDADTGTVLFSRNADSLRYPASLTKMMTLYMTFDALDKGTLKLDQKLKVSKRASGQAPSKLYLEPGETITVEQAIKALITKSANDVATVLAEAMGGTEYQFALNMTQQARQLGMYKTTFRNASGLPNRRQKTTASDLATLARALYDHFPQYYSYFATKSFTWKDKTYTSHNSLLKSYTGTDGIKTGYTRASGFNLTTSAVHDDERLIGVVLGGRSSKTRDAHMKLILDQSFSKLKKNPELIPRLVNVPTPRLKPGTEPLFLVKDTSGTAVELASNSAADELGNDIETGLPIIEQGDQSPPRDWGIQIGAFKSAETAREYLNKAQAATPKLLSAKDTIILPVETNAGTVYRARFSPISEMDAAQACVTLIDKGFSCFAFSEEIRTTSG